MKTKFRIILLLFSSSLIFSQVPKTVLMEYATNASCAPCAAANPGSQAYLESNYGRMVSIWYHGWWPGSGDPMYVANTPENENRIGYYNVNAVPRFIIDGTLQGYGDEPDKMKSYAESHFASTSPVKLKVDSKIENDSLDVTLTLVVYGDVTQSSLKLQTVIIEQIITYDGAPGSNGEVSFPHVFRKFINGVGGIDIANLNVGDSLTYNMKEAIDSEWKRDEIAIVAFLQSNSTKEVIQAATERKLHSISGNSPNIDLVNKNQSISYPYTITNYQSENLKLFISLDVTENVANWDASIEYNGNSIDTFTVELVTGEVVDFSLNVETEDVPDHIRLSISAKNVGGEIDYETTLKYLVLVKAGDIMLIDDDGGNNIESNFSRALLNDGKDFTKIDHGLLSEVKEQFDMANEYKAVLWNLGDFAPSLQSPDLSWILSYLNAGGRVLFSGSDFAHDIHDVQRSTVGQFFFRNYLDVNYLTDSVEATTLSSVPGNPLFDTLNIQLNSQYSTLPDGVSSRKGESHMVMQFDGTDNYGIILREKNTYKTAYITFGLEQITSETTQDLVVKKIIDWFATPVVGVEESSEIKLTPKNYGLEQNYPNPFNPSTVISYQLPEFGNVKIKVYDILGNEVANLVNEKKNSGYHSVEFNASHLTSGIYFYSINVGSFYQVNKMLLIK